MNELLRPLPTWMTQSSIPSDKNKGETDHEISITSLDEEEKEPDLVSLDNEEIEVEEEEEEDDTYEDCKMFPSGY